MMKKANREPHEQKIVLVIIMTVFLTLLTSCLGIAEKAGNAVEHTWNGTIFNEKTIETWRGSYTLTGAKKPDRINAEIVRDKTGKEYMTITLAAYPWMKLRADVPGADGVFFITGMHYLGGNPVGPSGGFIEFDMDVYGSGTFIRGGDEAAITLQAAVEGLQIAGGKMRLLTDTENSSATPEVLTRLRNQRERILALTEWMHKYALTNGAPVFVTLKQFEAYWQPILLDGKVSSQTLFPDDPELRKIRDGGAVLTDWAEAVQWIYTVYNRGELSNFFTGNTVSLKRVR